VMPRNPPMVRIAGHAWVAVLGPPNDAGRSFVEDEFLASRGTTADFQGDSSRHLASPRLPSG
jgi:hypothetical protein